MSRKASSPKCVEAKRPTSWQSKRHRNGVHVLRGACSIGDGDLVRQWTGLVAVCLLFLCPAVPQWSSTLFWHRPPWWSTLDRFETWAVHQFTVHAIIVTWERMNPDALKQGPCSFKPQRRILVSAKAPRVKALYTRCDVVRLHLLEILSLCREGLCPGALRSTS